MDQRLEIVKTFKTMFGKVKKSSEKFLLNIGNIHTNTFQYNAASLWCVVLKFCEIFEEVMGSK